MSDQAQKSILVIDDDITIRKLITHHLNLNDFHVVQAHNAEEGYSGLENNPIDLVLCDVMLGELDGFTFCEKVRENEAHRFIPFVFVTAKNTFEDKSRALEVGGDDIITKPFEIDELILKVKAILRRTEIYKVFGAKKKLNESFNKQTAKIVLVDDDVTLSRLFQFNLNNAGYDCQIAYDANAGLELVRSLQPDVIVSDIMMPGIDGFQFRKNILKDPEISSIPFIYLTAKATEQDILDGYDLDITDYVIKTAGPKVVVAKVSAIIKSLRKERHKIVSELHQAADSMHAKVVPEETPDFKGFEIKHWHLPFSGIPGGDFIDYFQLDDNHLAVILGDVMGKRWGAWYFAYAYAGYIRSSLRGVLELGDINSPSKILENINNSIYQDSKISEVFATLSVVVLDNKSMIAKYSGAGDLPIMYKNNSSGLVSKIQADGLLLGFSPDGKFEDSIVELEAEDRIILATDGIVESTNGNNLQYGSKRLMELVKNFSAQDDYVEGIKNDITKFTRNNFDDDISLMVITAR